MMPSDSDAQQYVKEKSDQLVASAMASKVRGVVDNWEAERRGKAAVARGAILGLLLLIAVSALCAFLVSYSGGLVFLGGFVIWVIFVGVLIWRNLGSRRDR